MTRNAETGTRRRNCRKLHALLRWQLRGATRLNYVELFTAERDEVCSVQLIFFFCYRTIEALPVPINACELYTVGHKKEPT